MGLKITLATCACALLHAHLAVAQSSFPAPPTNGLVAYFPFENSVTNLGSNGMQLTANSGWGSYVSGAAGRAISVGTGTWQSVSTSAVLSGRGPRAFSFFAGPTAEGDVIGTGAATRTGGGFSFVIRPGGIFFWGHQSDTEFGIPLLTRPWRHVAVNYDSQVMSFYLDGQLFRSERLPAPLDTVAPAVFNLFSRNFVGQVDEVRLYNRVLTDCEILAVALVTDPARWANCAGIGTPSPSSSQSPLPSPSAVPSLPSNLTNGLIAHWPFDGSYSNVGTNGIQLQPQSGATGSFIPGQVDRALQVTAGYWSTPYVTGFPSNTVNSARSVAFWATRASSGEVTGWGHPDWGPNKLDRPYFHVYILQDTLYVWLNLVDVIIPLPVTPPSATADWRHFTVVYDVSGALSTYYNGALYDRRAVQPMWPANGSSSLLPGQQWEGNIGWNSVQSGFDDVRVYDRPLSDCDALALAAMPARPPPVACNPIPFSLPTSTAGPMPVPTGGGATDADVNILAIAGASVGVVVLGAVAACLVLRSRRRGRKKSIMTSDDTAFSVTGDEATGGGAGASAVVVELTEVRVNQVNASVTSFESEGVMITHPFSRLPAAAAAAAGREEGRDGQRVSARLLQPEPQAVAVSDSAAAHAINDSTAASAGLDSPSQAASSVSAATDGSATGSRLLSGLGSGLWAASAKTLVAFAPRQISVEVRMEGGGGDDAESAHAEAVPTAAGGGTAAINHESAAPTAEAVANPVSCMSDVAVVGSHDSRPGAPVTGLLAGATIWSGPDTVASIGTSRFARATGADSAPESLVGIDHCSTTTTTSAGTGTRATGRSGAKASAVAEAIAEKVRAGQANTAQPTLINYVPTVQLLGGRKVPCPVDYDEAIKAGFTPELWWKATHDEATGRRQYWHKSAHSQQAATNSDAAALVCTCFKCAPAGTGTSTRS